MHQTETIAAIATGMSAGGVGIIRISGPSAEEIAGKVLFHQRQGQLVAFDFTCFQSHTIHYGFVARDGKIIDEVLVLLMRAPRSFTMEDVVEIQCHGGIFVTKQVLEAVLSAGARLAEPGEFTKRAFLNGRIDLSQAEAVADVIAAKNSLVLSHSMKQLRGTVLQSIQAMRDRILDQVSFLEAALDDPEHMSLEGFSEQLLVQNSENICELTKLIDSAEYGMLMKEGIKTVIVGKPNAGKSSLLNALAKAERAIVTDIAGTTRDTLNETVSLGDIVLNIVDTAGIRQTEDAVEKIGVRLAIREAKEAQLILYVIDAANEAPALDESIAAYIGTTPCIVLCNKADLAGQVDFTAFRQQVKEMLSHAECLFVSMKREEDIEAIEQCIRKMFYRAEIDSQDDIMITSLRHKEALVAARSSLELVNGSIESAMPEDFYSIDLQDAYASLGYVIGEEVDEDLVNRIFSKFCMGK